MGAFPSSEERYLGSVIHPHFQINGTREELDEKMVGQFGEPSNAKCERYAAFASHLSRKEFDAIYWTLFFFVIIMLFVSSWKYDATVAKSQQFKFGSHEYKRMFKKCVYICAIYTILGDVACVMEVFALLALQFCDGEDLMALYWSTWTVMQVGAVIAMAGILLAAYNNIREKKNPPWALALGTPVLVVAGIGHALQVSMKQRVKEVRSASVLRRSRSRSRHGSPSRDTSVLPISREDTLRNENSDSDETTNAATNNKEATGRFLGWAADGGAIIQFTKDPGEIDLERGEVLGKNGQGHVTVAFKKKMTIVVPREDHASPTTSTTAYGALLSSSVDPEKDGAVSESGTPRPPRQAVVRIQSPEPMTPFSPFPTTPVTPASVSSTTKLNAYSRPPPPPTSGGSPERNGSSR